jgi:hypothetical protein
LPDNKKAARAHCWVGTACDVPRSNPGRFCDLKFFGDSEKPGYCQDIIVCGFPQTILYPSADFADECCLKADLAAKIWAYPLQGGNAPPAILAPLIFHNKPSLLYLVFYDAPQVERHEES